MIRPIELAFRFALTAGAGLLLVACDTGDGKTLPTPRGTLPPPTIPVETSELPLEGVGTLALDNPGQIVPDIAGEDPTSAFRVIAPWLDGSPIDVRNTCDGDDLSPALSWVAPPTEATELALIVVDESITDGPEFVHWAIAGIALDDISLREGAVPLGAVQALNFFGELGWSGPCPPVGDEPHIYRFTMYALNQQAELADGVPASDFLEFIKTVAIASADVTGSFQR